MADEMRDLLWAMDKRAKAAQERDRRQNTLEIGTIKGVTYTGASVQLSESGRFLRTVTAIQGVDLVIGATVILARIGRADWMIIGAIETENAVTTTRNNTNPVAQPQNLTCTAHSEYCLMEWDAGYFLIQCYEIQVNASAGETGSTTIITDNSQYEYHNTPATYYARVRAVGENYRRGSWTAWTEAVAGEASTFPDLADTPGSYTGHAGDHVAVNAEEDGLEFETPLADFLELEDVPNAYTGDGGKYVRVADGEDSLEFVTPTFLELDDAPAAYSGEGGNFVRVAAGETELEFASIPDEFTELTDTPGTYAGAAGRFARVNITEEALEFAEAAGAFLDLTDSPADYADQAGRAIAVKATEDGLEFVTGLGAGELTTINFLIDGGGDPITTGIKGDIVVDFDFVITSYTLLADQDGSIVVDVWKDSYDNAPPTDADSITAAAPLTLSGASKSHDDTLSGWTTSVSAGNVLRFNVDSADTIERATLSLEIDRVDIRHASLNFVIDGEGAEITTGIAGDAIIDFACTIQSVTLLADQSGDIVIDIWKDSYAQFPPKDGDTITGGAEPTLSGASKSQDSSLSGWTVSVSAGDILRFNVDSVATIERVVLSLELLRS